VLCGIVDPNSLPAPRLNASDITNLVVRLANASCALFAFSCNFTAFILSFSEPVYK